MKISTDKKPYILAVDFDGTLVQNKFPAIGEPIWEVVSIVKRAQAKGAKLILWTCRNGQSLLEAEKFCTSLGIHFNAVNENLPEVQETWGGDTRKIYCDAYIDDKNIDIIGLLNQPFMTEE